MNKLTISCLLAALGIALGAFGAHALKASLEASGHVSTWNTATQYHLLHAVALFVLAAVGEGLRSRWTFRLWTIGIVLFSGSLYGLAITQHPLLGPVTPIGGVAFIAGWITLVFENQIPRK